jgi:hypothetical protein
MRAGARSCRRGHPRRAGGFRRAREHEPVCGLGGFADTRGGDLDVVDPVACRVVVLDREARRSRLCEQRHSLGHAAWVFRIAALAVDVQRQRDRGGERRNVRDELVSRDRLVDLADRPGEAGARRCERLEAEGGEQARRADVPRVRHDEELLALVELPKGHYALAGACSSTSAGSPRRSSRLRSASALISAPRSNATPLNQSQVSITTTAERAPQALLYEPKRLT